MASNSNRLDIPPQVVVEQVSKIYSTKDYSNKKAILRHEQKVRGVSFNIA
jgi:hypothetical protein